MESGQIISIEIAGLRIKVLGRQFPDSQDYWDGNWLIVDCECEAQGSRVHTSGPHIHLSGLVDLRDKLLALQSGRSRTASSDFIEPEVELAFKVGSRGDIQFTVELNPSYPKQRHRFSFEIDLSYLTETLKQLQAVINAYPVREPK